MPCQPIEKLSSVVEVVVSPLCVTGEGFLAVVEEERKMCASLTLSLGSSQTSWRDINTGKVQ